MRKRNVIIALIALTLVLSSTPAQARKVSDVAIDKRPVKLDRYLYPGVAHTWIDSTGSEGRLMTNPGKAPASPLPLSRVIALAAGRYHTLIASSCSYR
jgi:hypothetical protein